MSSMSHEINLSHELLIMKNGSICLGSFANWTLRCFLDPFRYALFVEGMFTLKLHQFLIFLKLTIANSAKVFISLLFGYIVPIVFEPCQIFYLFFGESLVLVAASGRHELQNGKKISKMSSRILSLSKALRLPKDNSPLHVSPSVASLNHRIALPERSRLAHKHIPKISKRIIVLVFLMLTHLMNPPLISLVMLGWSSISANCTVLLHQALWKFVATFLAFLLSMLALGRMGVQFCQILRVATKKARNLLQFFFFLSALFLSFFRELLSIYYFLLVQHWHLLFFLLCPFKFGTMLKSLFVSRLQVLLLLRYLSPIIHQQASSLMYQIVRSQNWSATMFAKNHALSLTIVLLLLLLKIFGFLLHDNICIIVFQYNYQRSAKLKLQFYEQNIQCQLSKFRSRLAKRFLLCSFRLQIILLL